MVDFVVECTFVDRPEQEKQIDQSKGKAIEEGITTDPKVHLSGEEGDQWSIYVDGSSAQEDGGARILLVGPRKEEFKYSIKFRFPITNNVIEYEALLSSLRLAKKILVEMVILFIDSQLIARQVLGGYEVRDSLLARYHNMVGQIWKDFDNITMR